MERDAGPAHHVVLEMACARPARVLERAREPLGGRREAGVVVRLEPERLRDGEARVVACLLEHGHTGLQIREQPLGRHGCVRQEQRQVGRERHPRHEPGVADHRGDGGSLRQQLRGGGDLTQ